MRRALPILVLLLAALCACKPADDPRAPFTDSRIPPGLEHRFYPPQGWTWGLIKVGKAPAVRYGVAAPAATPRGQIVILPGQGETSEAWFWTVRDLVGRGYVVWVLEGSGQAGSGRYHTPRDIIDAPSLDPDVVAVAALANRMARPRYLLASGASGAVAVRAAALGLPLDGLLLVEPDLRPLAARRRGMSPRYLSTMSWMHRLGLGRMVRPGGARWREQDSLQDSPDRTGERALRHWLTRRWQRANPDLRMGDPSVDWLFAVDAETEAARLAWPLLKTRSLVVGDDICAHRPGCAAVPAPRPERPERFHAAFIGQLMGFIDPSRAALAPAPAAATVDDES